MGRSRSTGGTYELKARFSIESDTKGVEELEARLASLERRLNKFGTTKATATISERGADDVDKKLNNIERRMNGISDMEAEVRMVAEGDDLVENKLNKLERHANEMSKRVYKMQFEANTEQDQAKVENLGRTADNITRHARILRIMAQHHGFDVVGQQVNQLSRNVDSLSRQRATIQADMRGYNEVMQGIDSVERNLRELTARPWDVEIEGDSSHAQRVMSSLAAQARAQFARAYRLQIQAETQGFPQAAQQADSLKRQMLQLSQSRARIAVELDGASPAIAGLLSVKRAASGVEGTYTISIDYSRIGGAIASLGSLQGALRAATGAIGALGGAFRNANGGMGMMIRVMQGAMSIIMGLTAALAAIAVVSAGPLVAGFTIAAGAVGAFVAGLGLVAAVAAPVISALSNFEQNTKKVETTQKAATASSNALAQAEQGLAKANEQVATAARSGEQAISQAMQAHEDAIRGVDQARRQYDQAVQGVQDAEIRGEEQISSAIRAHQDAVEAVGEAERAVGKAQEDAARAAVDAQENIRQAIMARDDAIQAVADAEVAAAEQVADAYKAHEDAIQALGYAQQDYELAQQATADAQKELTMATEDYNDALATEQQRLLGLQYDLEGLGINQRQLALDIEEAARKITEAETSEERARAALRYEELLLRQKEGVLAIEQAQGKLTEAQTEGTSELQSAYGAQQGAIRGVEDAFRGEQRAADGVNDAQEQVGETGQAISKAQIEGSRGVADAQKQLAEANNNVARAQEEGARSVADAQERVADTQRALVKAIEEEQIAQQAIGKARDEAARGIADAQAQVLEAQLGIEDAMRREEQARQAVDEARLQADEQMRNALQGVEDAQRQVAEAAKENALAQDALNEAMGDMPTDKIMALRAAFIALWDDFKARTAEAREALIDFGIELATLSAGAIPHLADAANATTYAMIDGFRNVIAMWQDTGVFDNIITILGYIPSITQGVFEGLGGILGGLINVFAVAMPFVEQFAWYIADVGLRFATWSNSAEGRAQLQRFFESAAIVLPILWGYIYDIGAALINWSTQNPEQVVMIVTALGNIVSGVFWGVAALVQGLIAMETAVPGISSVIGAVMALSFATLLIPKGIRTALFDFVKFTGGVTRGMTGAASGVSTAGGILTGVVTRIKFLFISLGAVFSSAGGGLAGFRAVMMSSMTVFGLVSAPIWLIVAAVAALAAGAYLIYQNWDWIGPWFGTLWSGIQSTASAAWGYISGDIYAAGAAVWGFLQTQWGAIQTWWSAFWASFGVESNLSWAGIIGGIETALYAIQSVITTVMPYVATVFKFAWDNMVAVVTAVWGVISSIVSGGLQIVLGVFTVFAGILTLNWDTIWLGLSYIVSGVWTTIAGVVSAGFTAISTIFYNSLYALESLTGVNFTAIYDWVSWAVNGIWTTIQTVFTAIWTFLFGGSIIPDIYNSFVYYFNAIYTAVVTPFQLIGNIINVLVTGWQITWDAVMYGIWTTAGLVWNGIYTTVSSVLSFIGASVDLVVWGIQTTWDLVMYGIWNTATLVWNGIWTTVDAVIYGISSSFNLVVYGLQTTWDLVMYGIWTTAETVWNGIWGTVSAIWNALWTSASTIFQGISDTITVIWDFIFSDTDMTWNQLWTTLSTIWSGVWTELSSVFNSMWTTITTIWNGVWTDTETLWNSIWTAISTIWTGIYTTISTMLNDIWTYLSTTWTGIWTETEATWNSIWTALGDIWSGIYTTITTWLSDLWSYLSNAWSEIWTETEYVWDSIWTYLGDTWSGIYDTVTTWISDLWSYAEDAWYGMWEGIEAFGGWIYDSLNESFGTAIKTALDWLSTLLYGAQKVLDAIGDPGGWSSSIGEVAAAIDYYHDGGIKVAHAMAEGGTTKFMDRGGIGTDDPHPQHVVWNEQHGNEAWIAERGPRQQNLSYLKQAANWLGQSVVPKETVANHGSEEKPGVQVLPPPYHSLAGGAGTENKRKMMADGGVLYAAHGATLPWDSGLTTRTAEIANEIYADNNDGNLYYNSYYGHPDGYPEREAYSVDWWDSYRGGGAPYYGDNIASDATGYSEFSYYIWNGTDSYDGSIAASDPHYDHVHTTFMGDIGLGSGGGIMCALRNKAAEAIESFMPEVPEMGDGMVPDIIEGTGTHIRDSLVKWIQDMIKCASSGPASTEEVREWIRQGLEFGNAFSATEANIEEMASRAMQESSGDPYAINDYDINAQNGTPSKGLFQIIEPTWESYRASYGEDAGAFSDNWSDPVMSAAVASRYMLGKYGEIVGATGIGYRNGGIATGPQLGLFGEGGNEMMIPLDHPNAVRMLSKAFAQAEPARNRATQRASVTPAATDNLIVAGTEDAQQLGISNDAALIGEKIDSMKEEIKQSMRDEFAETELGGSTMEQMIKTAVATALAVVSSKGGQEIIDQGLSAKFDFDREMSEL